MCCDDGNRPVAAQVPLQVYTNVLDARKRAVNQYAVFVLLVLSCCRAVVLQALFEDRVNLFSRGVNGVFGRFSARNSGVEFLLQDG